MKKSVAAYWVFVLSLTVGLFVSYAETKAQLPDRILSLQELSFQLSSPRAIADYLWKNFLFEDDQRLFGKEDYWQTPEEFFSNKKGDCEDFAIFANDLLKSQGVQSFILNIYGGKEGHTICVFKQNGRYQAIDGSDFKPMDAASLNELITKIEPAWKNAAIVSPHPESRHAKIIAQINR